MRPKVRGLEVTLVTCYLAGMTDPAKSPSLAWMGALHPRRSLGAGAIWLIVALALTFSVSASIWVGSIARENVLEQHLRRLSLETDQMSAELGQAMSARLDAIEAAGRILRTAGSGENSSTAPSEVFRELKAAYPDLDWIAVADADGTVRGSSAGPPAGSTVAAQPWFDHGLSGPWLGVIEADSARANTAELGDMAGPLRDGTGRVIGVIAARLSWRRAPHHPERLTDEAEPHGAQAYVVDADEVVLAGPGRGRRWAGVALAIKSPADGARFERMPDGREVLVSKEPLSAGAAVSALGWQAILSEPLERVYQRADALAFKIFWVSMCLGLVTCLLGALGARRLTGRLERLTESVASVGQRGDGEIEIPDGVDEVARLARAFAQILSELRLERGELQTLSSELERRVAVRTLEVERLGDESRYAAIVRERLKIARDLHDTLAHSMMALLSEIRFLRKLQSRDPAAVPEELARAEQVAHEGLKEARSAISQMRGAAVREIGLGPALSNEFERFMNRTGIAGEFSADPESARFGDERAETILRMVQEALRNIERHSKATQASISVHTSEDSHLQIKIADNGIGFDPDTVPPAHFGIIGLREHADLIGAELRIESGPNQGTRLTFILRTAPSEFVAG